MPYMPWARGRSRLLTRPLTDSSRYITHPNGYHAAIALSEDYAIRARGELDIDDPSIDCLQALLLLTLAFSAGGKGKKAYMMLSLSYVFHRWVCN